MEKKNILLSPFSISLASSIMTIIVGLLLGLILLYATSPDKAWSAFKMIISGGFPLTGFLNGVGRVFYFAVPIMMTGLAVAFAMKTGVFNIGAAGQFMMGLYAGILVGIQFQPVLGTFTWVAALIAGALAGAIWGFIQGVLQAYKHINEIICGIMMNYVALFLVNIMIRGNNALYFGGRNWTNSIPKEGLLPQAGLNKLFVGSGANSGIIFAIIFCIIAFIILQKTKLGYEMKACGFNADASKYAGINVGKSIVVAMLLAGMFAGLGGVMYQNGSIGQKYTLADSLRSEGMTGIPVALLGNCHPIGTIFSALFIAYLQAGGQGVQSLGLQPEIVSVITAVIIYFCSFSFLFRRLWSKMIKKVCGVSE